MKSQIFLKRTLAHLLLQNKLKFLYKMPQVSLSTPPTSWKPLVDSFLSLLFPLPSPFFLFSSPLYSNRKKKVTPQSDFKLHSSQKSFGGVVILYDIATLLTPLDLALVSQRV